VKTKASNILWMLEVIECYGQVKYFGKILRYFIWI